MKLQDKLFTKGMVEVVKDGDKEEKLFIASDDVEDRQGEIISQDGWQLENFRANPVIQWAHDSKEPAIATAEKIGFKLINGKKKLVYEPKFHRKTPMSNYIADLVEAGVIKASSVGFKPLDWDDETYTYTKAELLEISFVNVPANQNALSLGMAKGYGMDIIKQVMPDIKIEEKMGKKEIKEKTEIQEIEKAEEKGEIEEEIQEQEKIEQKYQKMDKFWNIIYAFCDVYFKDETDPNKFEELLSETASLLKSLSDGIMETIDEKIAQVDKKELVKFISIKEKSEEIDEEEDKGTEEIEEAEGIEKETEKVEEEKNIEARIQEIETIVDGLSHGIKTMDQEIIDKFNSFEESISSLKNNIELYITSQSEEKSEEKGVVGREPNLVTESKADQTRRLALKALNKAVEVLNKTK